MIYLWKWWTLDNNKMHLRWVRTTCLVTYNTRDGLPYLWPIQPPTPAATLPIRRQTHCRRSANSAFCPQTHVVSPPNVGIHSTTCSDEIDRMRNTDTNIDNFFSDSIRIRIVLWCVEYWYSSYLIFKIQIWVFGYWYSMYRYWMIGFEYDIPIRYWMIGFEYDLPI
jgi:hypothetical protein